MPSDPTSPPEPHDPDLLECDDEESSAGALEPGLLAAPQPLGLDGSEFAHTHRESADLQFSQWRRRGGLGRKIPARPTLAGIPLPVRPENPEGEETDAEEEKKDDRKSRAAQALSYIRGKLSEGGVAQITAMIHDPGLALTTIQADIVNRIGRYGSHGDKAGVRRALMELVEKVDVSSPKDGAVLAAREEAGDVLSSNLTQQMAVLEGGKQSLQMTQGGRVIGRIQSILGQHKAFGWADGMDRGWRRLTERFGQQANGAIDVVVSAKEGATPGALPGAAPVQAPVGSWNVPGSGAAPAADARPVGAWVTPDAAAGAPAPGAQQVGSWVMPDAAGGAQAAGQPAVGQWTTGSPGGPAGGAAPGDAPQIGKWALPGQPAPGVPGQGAAAQVGQWTTGNPGGTPGAPAPGDAPQIGKWAAPGQPAPGVPGQGAAAQVGQWTIPSGEPGAASAERSAPAVGKWDVAGKFMNGADIPLAGDLNLTEILKQNPNVSNVRLVELVQSAESKQPPKLRAIADIARSVFGKKFGF